jgi:hypothetical protein
MNEQDTNPNPQIAPQEQATATDNLAELESVKLWQKRVKDARVYYKEDFDRMRENMAFAGGIQWEGQDSIDDKEGRYVSNIITNFIENKVASLYAKNPECEAEHRKRLNYKIWDGTVETLQAAHMAVQQAAMMGMPTPQSAQAAMLLQDVAQGKQIEAICDRIGKTIEILYKYQCDTQAPSFKFQMKQLVRQVITTGVGYVRLNYVDQNENVLSSSTMDDSIQSRVKRAKNILQGIQDDKINDTDPRIQELGQLFESVQASVQQGDTTNIQEHLEFDFPSSTAIIPDTRCKSLKGFIGARWIAQQYLMSLDDANSYFELRGDRAITTGGSLIQYADDSTESPRPTDNTKPDDLKKTPLGCFWEVFDLDTKCSFWVCDGYKYYCQQPKPVDPQINRFWPIFSLTFNDIVVETGQKVHIFPPSDVQLLKPIQKERNRSRQELREQRIGNRPFHWTLGSYLTDADKEKLRQHETHELLELQGAPQNGDMNLAMGHWQGVPIDQNMYSTQPLNEDATLAVGSTQVQQGAPIRHVAATPAVIQEQARISGVSSNVDDLDDLLSELAQSGGEMMIRKFSPQTVMRIVGPGAAWPQDNREDYLNQISLDIVAASSGRPNKAVDVQNATQLVPLMISAGANPWAIIEYVVKIMDANLDPTNFAPPIQSPMQPQQGQGQQLPRPQG